MWRFEPSLVYLIGKGLATLSLVETFIVNLLPSCAADAWFYECYLFGRVVIAAFQNEILPRQIKHKWTWNLFQLFPNPLDCCNADCKSARNMTHQSSLSSKVRNDLNSFAHLCEIIYMMSDMEWKWILQQQHKHANQSKLSALYVCSILATFLQTNIQTNKHFQVQWCMKWTFRRVSSHYTFPVAKCKQVKCSQIDHSELVITHFRQYLVFIIDWCSSVSLRKDLSKPVKLQLHFQNADSEHLSISPERQEIHTGELKCVATYNLTCIHMTLFCSTDFS